MIKNVFLDMDGTLLDFHKAESVALSKVLSDLGVEATDEKIALYSKINLAQWKRLEKGEIDRERVLVGRFELFFEAIGEEKDSFLARKIYENYLSQGHFLLTERKNCLMSFPKSMVFCILYQT